ncbi:cation acetate symporter [Actinomycetospora termitidis]|uniref:Cation acetate symporter n=1 Tax=Actinomycetospora termitidis TaxID=3053470 RepID=A0ABT7M244_9PSEU|nr:cation acetate symporter [Actinomycetospora sp. Odt1-22]MDL5154730.1 cation acetate symporter [Actinomycetospora sp. Odt1-22]
MSTVDSVVALVLFGLAAVAVIAIGSLGVRVTRSTDDFLAASRTVRSRANAAAIAGQSLSVASFLGIAGIVLSHGVDGLWYPVGFAAGFGVLLLFVAAPLRRSGAYTVPDFAETRLDSTSLRTLTTLVVVIIGWLYLVPQLQASGLVFTVLTGAPGWVGILAVGLVVTAAVTFGGMRSMTLVQAFGFWLKAVALVVPAVVLVAWFLGTGLVAAPDRGGPTTFDRPTTVRVADPTTLRVDAPVQVEVRAPGQPRDTVTWQPGTQDVARDTTLVFPAGARVPVVGTAVADDSAWDTPFGSGDRDPLWVYSLLLATCLGTAGLPHVLVRYYTNPDGRAARRSTVLVIALLGAFSIVPIVLGALSRSVVPQLLTSGEGDAVVLLLPSLTVGGWAGAALGGVVAAGVAATLLSVSAGLLLSVAGVLSSDVLPGRLGDFRIAAHVAGVVPIVGALLFARLEFAHSVALALAVAASTFAPLLLLGIWWRGLTDRGALAGIAVGGTLSLGAAVTTLCGVRAEGVVGTLLAQPAAVSVPAAVIVMVAVSRATSSRVPAQVGRTLLRLHAPERLGLGEMRVGR